MSKLGFKIKNGARGFTLIELLVVIALIAVLSIVVLLYLNPVEFLKQARDSDRFADLSSLKNALTLYIHDQENNASLGVAGTCYQVSSVGTTTANCQLYFATATAVATSTSLILDGTGWLPVNFSKMTTGAPISQLAQDPLGTGGGTFFYSYIANAAKNTFKLSAKIESNLYGFGGSRDAVTNDGGISTSTFEIGSDLSL